MDVPALILVSIGLAMDAFAVSLGIGTSGQANSPRPVFSLSFHMGFFQGMMTFLGWLAGSSIVKYISSVDHWIAFVLLAFVGVNMIREGINPEEEVKRNDPSRGSTLLLLCVATSIDAMAVGLSMAMLEVNLLLACLMIGFITLGLSLFGLLFGRRLGERFGQRMEILGGIILIGIGLRILFTHLTGQ